MKITTFNMCPSLMDEGYDTFSPKARKELFDGAKVSPFTDIPYNAKDFVGNVKHVSISGMQEKMFAVVDKNKLRLTYDGEQSRYIIKPSPKSIVLDNAEYMPINEHLTMQIARQVYGINTAHNALIVMGDGRPAYIVRRFDVAPDGTKYRQEDFASILGRTAGNGSSYKYEGSYLEIGRAIREIVPIWRFELQKFFSIVIFNYLFANGDAHLKNFSLCTNPNGVFALSPAYDLLNTSIHLNDSEFALSGGLGTNVCGKHPTSEDFALFGSELGLTQKQIDKTLELFTQKQPLVEALCLRSLLSKKCKRMYIRSYGEKLARLQKK